MATQCQETCMTDGECTCAPRLIPSDWTGQILHDPDDDPPASYDRELDRIHATRRSLSRMDGRDDPLNDRLDRIAQQANARGRE